MSPPLEAMGFPVLQPIVDSSRFVTQQETPATLSDGRLYINDRAIHNAEGNEREWIVSSILRLSIDRYLIEATKYGKSGRRDPYILGFVFGIEKNLQTQLEKEYSGRYDFSDYNETAKMQLAKTDAVASSVGQDAYQIVERACHDKGWEGCFAREILRFVCNERENAFKAVVQTKNSEELAEYLLSRKIARLSQEQLQIKDARQSYVKVCEYTTSRNQWCSVKDEITKLVASISNAGETDIAKELDVLKGNFDTKFSYDSIFCGAASDEMLSTYFEHLGEITRKLGKWLEGHEKKERKLYFGL
jgi:hypothetical protein